MKKVLLPVLFAGLLALAIPGLALADTPGSHVGPNKAVHDSLDLKRHPQHGDRLERGDKKVSAHDRRGPGDHRRIHDGHKPPQMAHRRPAERQVVKTVEREIVHVPAQQPVIISQPAPSREVSVGIGVSDDGFGVGVSVSQSTF